MNSMILVFSCSLQTRAIPAKPDGPSASMVAASVDKLSAMEELSTTNDSSRDATHRVLMNTTYLENLHLSHKHH